MGAYEPCLLKALRKSGVGLTDVETVENVLVLGANEPFREMDGLLLVLLEDGVLAPRRRKPPPPLEPPELRLITPFSGICAFGVLFWMR